MKRCPTCSRTFEDTLTYCLIDGSVLSAPFGEERGSERDDATQILPSNESLNGTTDSLSPETPAAPTMTAMYQPVATPRIEPPDTIAATQTKPYGWLALVAVTTLFFVVATSVLLVLNRSEFFSYTVFMLLRRLPVFVVAVIGIILSVVRMKRHPRASMIVIMAMVLFAFAAVFFTSLLHWITRNMSGAESIRVYDVGVVIEDFAFAAETILLVAAAYSGRQIIAKLTPEGT